MAEPLPTDDSARSPRILGYARVSTAEQNLDLQLDAFDQAGCQRVYQEHASGARVSRPELDRLLAAIRPGDTLVVWKLDRLGRSLAHIAGLLANLRERGIHFRSLQDGLDTRTAQGRAMVGMAAVFAELERELIRERTHAGLAAARARGRRGGRKRVMSPTRVQLAREMYASKQHTVEAIAKALGVGRATIYRALG